MSTKIPAMALVREAQRMWAENWQYVWRGASKNKIDCSGVFVYVYKQHGKKIYHGSNRIARVHVERLIPIDEAMQQGLIVPGMAAFRSYEPGHKKHSISAAYKEGGQYYTGDLRDYYHIGVVDEDVGWVLNAAGTRYDFERHPIDENWSHVARLLDVDYDMPYEEDEPMIDEHETIREGAKGNAVVAMQGLLQRHGYDIEADGKFGPKSKAALKDFQRKHGLAVDGICGPLTWAKLREGMGDPEMEEEQTPSVAPGDRSPQGGAQSEKTWEQMTLEERVEDLHMWRLSMTGGGDTDG